MAIILTFDIEGAHNQVRNRIQSMFLRLGWQHLGGSSYRYPRLGADQPVEDWFNHVIPALALFRCLIRDNGLNLKLFTLDAQSSGGYSPDTYGSPPRKLTASDLYPSHQKAFGEAKLLEWINDLKGPY